MVQMAYGATVVLQNGLNGYNGCVDSWFRDDESTNHGNDVSIKVSPQGSGCPRCHNSHTVIKFNLSSIPSGANVSSAVLSLHLYENDWDNNVFVLVNRITKDWDDQSVNWFNAKSGVAWSYPGGDYSTPTTRVNFPNMTKLEPQFINYSVTAAVQGFIQNPASNLGLIAHAGDGNAVHYYRSSEYAVVSERPKLTITYTTTSVQSAGDKGNNSGLSGLDVWSIPAASGRTDIGLYLTESEPFTLQMYDMTGKLLWNFHQNDVRKGFQRIGQGAYQSVIDGRHGLYILILKQGNNKTSRSIVTH
jgi:hypothetical protein